MQGAFTLLLSIGAIQGLIMGIYLWRTNSPRKLANQILSVLLFFLAYRLLAEALKNIDVLGFNSWTYHVFLEYNWIFGSLIYFYISSYISPAFKLERKHLLHLIPVLLEFIVSNYVKIQNFYWDGTRSSLTWLGDTAYRLWMHTPFQLVVFNGLILFYVIKSRQLLNEYTAKDSLAVQSEDISWVSLIIKLMGAFALFTILISTFDYLFLDFAFDPIYKFPVYGGMAILTYWLALQGFTRRNSVYKISKSVTVDSAENQTEITKNLHAAMKTHELYKNPKLTLGDLAKAIGVKPHQLTQVLNRSIGKNFSDFVNGFRVKEAERMINSDTFKKYTLLAIAYESGFNSKASFNRAVKKLMGKAPKDLRRN